MPEDTAQRAYSMSLTGRVEEHEDSYISFCNELPLAGIGATPEDAMNSFLMCLKDYLNFSEEWGITDSVMDDYGFTAKNTSVRATTGNFEMMLPNVASGKSELEVVA